ncbi:MAG: (2Fe-2S)-binding protein [Luteimonas sp.]
MYVCLCNGVTDRDIQHAARAGCKSMPELTMRTGCGANCGSCVAVATETLQQARQDMLVAELVGAESSAPAHAMSHAA